MNKASLHSFTSNAYGRDDLNVSSAAYVKKGAGMPVGPYATDDIQGSFGVHDTTGAFVFGLTPLGFIPCSESRTDFKQGEDKRKALFLAWDKKESYLSRLRTLKQSPLLRKDFLASWEPRSTASVGFKTRTYASGEVTGGFYHTGRDFRMLNLGRSGPLQSTELTQKARTKIRRAVECSPSHLRYFWTLTFSPSNLHEWEKNEDGTVRHDFAKYKLKKFLHACSMKQRRLKRELLYAWVAEIQTKTTNNIHFHILLNQFFNVQYMTKIWNQGANAVDVAKPIKTPEHAAAYMKKYMTKDENSLIQGFRYRVSNGLNAGTIPKERELFKMSKRDHYEEEGETTRVFLETLQSMKDEIESRGGRIMDFGFSIQKPRSARKYKNKNGDVQEVPGIDPRLGKQITDILCGNVREDDIPF